MGMASLNPLLGASQIFGPEVCRSDQTAFRRVSRPCSHEHASYCQYSAIIWDAPSAPHIPRPMVFPCDSDNVPVISPEGCVGARVWSDSGQHLVNYLFMYSVRWQQANAARQEYTVRLQPIRDFGKLERAIAAASWPRGREERMSNKWALITVVAAVIGALLLVLAAGASASAATVAASDAPNSSVSPTAVASTQDEGEVTHHTVTLTNGSTEPVSYTVSTGAAFTLFSSGCTFYGYNPSYGMPLMVVGLEDDISIVVTNLADGSTLDSRSALDRYETVRMYIPNRVAYKVASDKPVVAYESLFTGWSHNTFIPSIDSGAVGTEFIFHLNAVSNGAGGRQILCVRTGGCRSHDIRRFRDAGWESLGACQQFPRHISTQWRVSRAVHGTNRSTIGVENVLYAGAQHRVERSRPDLRFRDIQG